MLEIDRLSLHVRAAAAHEHGERLARRLRDAALKGIEGGRYAPAPPGDPAYLFVERLAVHCAVSTEWDDDAIGAAVARALAAALERSAAHPRTLAFRDRAELLAAFYGALAEGRAWERWWLEAFDGLRALPASAALRTSVMNEGTHGVAALARLTGLCLSRVLDTLSAGDAARLAEWFAQRPASGKAAGGRSLWTASDLMTNTAGALRALVTLERQAPGAACGETLRVLQSMHVFRSAAMRGELRELLIPQAPAHERLLAAAAKLGLDGAWIRLLDEADAALIADELACAGQSPSRDASSAASAPAVQGERLFTSRGGVFVLLKALDWLGWPAQWATQAGGDELARATAWAVALRALEPRGLAGFADPALALAFGVERPLALLRTHRRRTRAMAGALLDEFSRRIPGLAGASPGYLRRNALALGATVERDGERCTVRLGRAPLDILLVLGGAKTGRVPLPGLGALELRAESAE
jgi:hypothetical protein